MTNLKILAVLGYHKIGPYPNNWYTWSYVPTETFVEQLQYLHEHNWQVLSFEAFLQGLQFPDLLPERSVLLTFDDGYRSNLTIAAPVLQRFGFPAVIFVPTAFVGGYNAFDYDLLYEPREDICSWSELKELQQFDFSVQSHSVNHPHFSNLSPLQIETELKQSKDELEQKLGKLVHAISFPYGDIGLNKATTFSLLSSIDYTAAFAFAGTAVQIPLGNPFCISRVAVGFETNLASALQLPT